MAELNKKEFAAMCRTTVAVVNTNINRKKLVYNKPTKTIDTTNAQNKQFFERYSAKADAKPVQKKKVEYEDVVETIEVKSNKKKKKKADDDSDEIVSWDARKKRADALLQERKAEKEQLNLEKLAGKLIPVDLTFSILRAHNHNIFATIQNDAENIASIYCDILAGGDRKKLAEITTKLSEKLETVIKRSKDVAMASIEQAVEDYSITRNRGERK